MPTSNQTRHALKVIREYLEGENEAVQYELEFMANQVTQSSSGIIGGFQAGNVPSNDVVTDNGPQVFELNASPTGSPTGSVSLNLNDGQLTASWTYNGTTINVSGEVRCVESLSGQPMERFLFVIGEPGTGFYVLTTTNI
jgi:hypothetical protein